MDTEHDPLVHDRRYMNDSVNVEYGTGSDTRSHSLHHGSYGKTWIVWMASIFACLGPLEFGFSLAFTSPTLDAIDKEFNLDGSESSLFASLVSIGAMVGGGLLGGPLASRFGRRTTIQICSVPFIAGYLLLSEAHGLAMLYAARVIIGLAVGVVSLSVPMYLAEIAPPSIRGVLGTCNQLAISAGVLLAYLFGLPKHLSWRWVARAGLVPPAVCFIGLMLFGPESPGWLLSRGKRSRARQALRRLRCTDDDELIERELAELEDAVSVSAKPSLGGQIKRLMSGQSRPLLLSLAQMVFQQMCGINAVIFYAGSIFKTAGFSNSALAAVLVGVTQVVFTAVSAFLIDRKGRRTLLLVSMAGLAVSISCLGGYFYSDDESLSWVALVSLLAFIAFFSIGAGPIPWILMGELFAADVRSLASSMATCLNWGLAFLVTQTFDDMKKSMDVYGTFWFFGGWCLLGWLTTLLAQPETKGRSLHEIQYMFETGSNKPY